VTTHLAREARSARNVMGERDVRARSVSGNRSGGEMSDDPESGYEKSAKAASSYPTQGSGVVRVG
jgi:hypothetical protein